MSLSSSLSRQHTTAASSHHENERSQEATADVSKPLQQLVQRTRTTAWVSASSPSSTRTARPTFAREEEETVSSSSTTFQHANAQPLHDDHSIHNNNDSLPLAHRLAGDMLIGLGVTAMIAPSLTAIDQALVQSAARTHHTFQSSFLMSTKEMVRHPWRYLKSPAFVWMWATYASTYIAANCLDTLSQENERRLRRHERNDKNNNKDFAVSSSTMAGVSFCGTTAANSAAALCKDAAYARLFGNANASVKSVPLPSYALWLARDCTVIGASFVAPPIVAQWMEGNTQDKPSARSRAAAQLATPMAAQLVAGPLHFLGLDVYNDAAKSWQNRWRALRQSWASVVAARVVRIVPGYGVGGVWNQQLRTQWNACGPFLWQQPQPLTAAAVAME